MDVVPLPIEGAWLVTPRQFRDDRGVFLETFKADVLEPCTGHRFPLAQANTSVSRRGALRGIHFADVPPGQAKYVTCVAGAILDVVVDIRTGSPTYGSCATARLDDVDRRAVYVAEGLGHAFVALTDEAVVSYLCSTPYDPSREHALNPLDPALQVEWPNSPELALSAKDAAAPTLAEAARTGLLPAYDDCLAFYDRLRQAGTYT